MREVKLLSTLKDQNIELIIFPDSPNDYLETISEYDVDKWGEASIQLQEGCSYHYQISQGFQLHPIPGLVIPFNKPDNNRGLIKPGNYVGTFVFTGYLLKNPITIFTFNVEIRSRKTNYRTEYRYMLEEIAYDSVDLILKHSSPVIQHVAPNYNIDHRSIYQKFSFINSIIGTEDFFDAVYRIIRSPVSKWISLAQISDVRKTRKPSKQLISSFAASLNRVAVPVQLKEHIQLSSLPKTIVDETKQDSIDTPENQFVKHVLTEYFLICDYIKDRLLEGSREKMEAELLRNRLKSLVDHEIFKDISQPSTLTLNSPVLQNKDGYREVFKSWLLFELGLKLTWTGGDNVFRGGKKDVAKLYEYWVYFKLLNIVTNVFPEFSDSSMELIKPSSNGLDLNLCAGNCNSIRRICNYETRNIEVEFSYNQTFYGSNNNDYPKSGSWTRTMKPDYTISFWPEGFSKKEAEEQEQIIHIHFDAKYRIDNIIEAFGPSEFESNETIDDNEIRDFRRIDLIKMHAYKDAIRRTAGAYIIYPGTENKIWRGYHEIIPGIGAFALRPSKGNEGWKELQQFLEDVLAQLLNRASKYEETTYHIFNTQSKPPLTLVKNLPEMFDAKRLQPPTEIRCLVGDVKNKSLNDWMERHNLYSIYLGSDQNGNCYDQEFEDYSKLTYLLIYNENELVTSQLFDVLNPNPRLISKEKMLRMGYPDPKHELYLVFSVTRNYHASYENIVWDLSKLEAFSGGKVPSRPFVISLFQLMAISNIEK